jgi:uncharacterized membrane protein
MTLRTSLLIQFGLLLASIVIGLVMAARMPEVVPTHWNAQGQPDAFGSKWVNVWMGPGLMAFSMVLTIAIPWLSPKGYRVETFGPTYAYAMSLVGGLFFLIHMAILMASGGTKFDLTQWLMVILFLFFALLGNVTGRIKQNFYMGIRTPWTLANERVWTETHRSAGLLWTVGGIVGALVTIAGLPFWWSFGAFMVMSCWPVVQSYLIYRKLA